MIELHHQQGSSKAFATSVMIHVGGEYQRSDNKTYIAGSFGCFGVYNKNGDNLVGGNEATNAFIKDVQNRQGVNKDKSLHINANQRDSVRWNEVVKKLRNKIIQKKYRLYFSFSFLYNIS